MFVFVRLFGCFLFVLGVKEHKDRWVMGWEDLGVIEGGENDQNI